MVAVCLLVVLWAWQALYVSANEVDGVTDAGLILKHPNPSSATWA
jgi:hypothetical protein